MRNGNVRNLLNVDKYNCKSALRIRVGPSGTSGTSGFFGSSGNSEKPENDEEKE